MWLGVERSEPPDAVNTGGSALPRPPPPVARRKAAEEFVESAAKLPVEKQIEAVRARLATLEAEVVGEMVTEAKLLLSNRPHDLTPLMAFEGLKKLTITAGPECLDLSPVNALPLEELTCREAMAKKNAPVLAEIKTLKTINGQPGRSSGCFVISNRFQGRSFTHPDFVVSSWFVPFC